MVLADLVQFCQDRGLSTEGSKTDLIEGLINWVVYIHLLMESGESCLSQQQRDPGVDYDFLIHYYIIYDVFRKKTHDPSQHLLHLYFLMMNYNLSLL